MANWQRALRRVLTGVEARYDGAKFRLRQRMGLGRLCVVPYLGYGTTDALSLQGRVLRDKGITSAMEDDSIWRNMLNMFRRYNSDEIPGARLRAQFGDLAQEVVADKEGYFEMVFRPQALPPSEDMWHEIAIELVDYPGKAKNPAEPQTVQAIGRVIVPPPDAEFGVISDIDDTVLRTDVVNLLAMARNTFLKNARTRLPFEGAAAFYDALRRGAGSTINPIYYVTSSPWNLYDLIVDFFVVRGIPLGPLFMVNWGLTVDQFLTPGHHRHKMTAIQNLLETYPALPFILIGDSGQKDPEIYLEVILNNPGRILAAYIRDVTGATRDSQVQLLIHRARENGVEMLMIPDTFEAARHAADKGYITADRLALIMQERDKDHEAPTPLEQAVMPDAES